MKKFTCNIIIIIALFFCQWSAVNGQAANNPVTSIPYQAVARDAGGNLIANHAVSLRFSLITDSATGPVIYQETQTATTNQFGLFTVNIYAAVASTTGTFNPAAWQVIAALGAFTKVEIDVTGGTNYVNMGTTRMLYVPFALYAEAAGVTPGAVVYKGTWDAMTNTPALTSSVGKKGDLYLVSNASPDPAQNTMLDGNSRYKVGDAVIYNDYIYQCLATSNIPLTAPEILFTPTPVITSTNVQDAIEEVNSQFTNLLDSYIHETDDGLSIYLPPTGTIKRLGIGVLQPDARLSISGESLNDDRMISLSNAIGSQNWNINLNPTASDVPGFSIDDATAGTGTSRFFIQPQTGFVGLGNVTPQEKLHVSGLADGGDVSMQIENLASGHNGWLLSHLDDNTVVPRAGTFGIIEKNGTTNIERITVLPSLQSASGPIRNVGINETLPYSTLHVSRPVTDTQRDVALIENTGVLLLGPIDDKNLAFDSHQIQARTGSYVGGGTTLSFTTTPLNIQPLGGDVIIHNDLTLDHQVVISESGKIGIGKTPVESMDVNGAITIGDATSNPANGTIRWSGTDFEGRMPGAWVSLTASSSASNTWQQPGGPNTELIYFDPAGQHPKVGIGTITPSSALQVEDNSQVSGTNAVTMRAISQGSLLTSTANYRIGLEINNTNTWSSNASARDIGIYVSNVSGQSASNSNIAAVFNGNTVIGDLTGSSVIGTNGRNVLAIQTGAVPTSAIGSTANGGIQIYADTDPIGTSIFHLMNGDGSVIKLYRAPALTPANTTNISSTSYGTNEADVINNLRLRINDLESRLQAIGLLN